MADQTVSMRLEADTSAFQSSIQASADVMDQLSGSVSSSADSISTSLEGATSATEELSDANKGAAGFWDEHSTAITGAGAALAGAGAALEAFNRSQQDTRFTASRVANTIEGETTDSIIKLATEVHDATRDLDDMVATMEIGAQQGIRSGDALQDYALFWDTVADATGESQTQLAGASSALRAVGIDAGNEGEALAAFGFIARDTTSSVAEFLQFLERMGPELNEMGLSLDDSAALLGILEHEFGMSGRTARQEFRKAVNESDGTLGDLMSTLGLTEAQFETYTAKVAESSEVINENAAAYKDSLTPMQEIQARIEALMLEFSWLGDAMSMLSPILIGGGGVIVALNQLRQLSPRVSAGLGTVARSAGGLAAGLGALGAAYAASHYLADRFNTVLDEAEGVMNNLSGSTTDQLVSAFDSIASNMGSVFSEAEATAMQLGFFREAAESNIGTAERLRDELAAQGRETADLDAIIEDVAASTRQAADDQDRAAGMIDGTTDSINDATEAWSGYADQLRSMFDPLFATQDAIMRLADEQAAYEELVESGTATEAELEAKRRDVIRATVDHQAALFNLKQAVEVGDVSVGDSIATLQSWVDQGLITQDQADATAEEFRGLGGIVDELDGSEVGITAEAHNVEHTDFVLNNLARERTARIYASLIGGGAVGAQIAALTSHDGGVVPDYLADGGFPFRGTGTDVIPAMLTPGEFVVRAEAVEQVGVPFMNALNSGYAPSAAPPIDYDRLARAMGGASGPSAPAELDLHLEVSSRDGTIRTLRKTIHTEFGGNVQMALGS